MQWRENTIPPAREAGASVPPSRRVLATVRGDAPWCWPRLGSFRGVGLTR